MSTHFRPAGRVAGWILVGLLVTSCGGDDDADADADESETSEQTSQTETGTEPADDDDAPSGDDGDTPDGATAAADDDTAGAADGDDDGGDDDGATDGSDVDWATVDLSTIDWANIDLGDIDFGAIEENPTIDQISEADLTIIQERMAAQFGTGAVTLTIGDRSWEFDGFRCGFESAGVLNEGTILGTNLFGEVDGTRFQLQIDVYDDETAQFTMDDLDDFENPTISYLETEDITVEIDGNTIRASGDVTDQASETFDVAPMTFEGECGPDSLR